MDEISSPAPAPIRSPGADEALPRKTYVRVLSASLLWILAVPVPVVIDRSLHWHIDTLSAGPLVRTLVDSTIFLPVVICSVVATLVSYRPRDGLLFLILPLGLPYSFIFFWRLVFLPYRDWRPRLDEKDAWEEVAVSGARRPVFRRRPAVSADRG